MNTVRTLFIVVLFLTVSACASVREQEEEEKNTANIVDINLRLGLGYLQRGSEEDAVEKFQKALSASPDSPEAHSSIALAYVRLGENEKAQKHYLRALELSPKDGSIQNNYAVFLCGIGKQFEAEAYFISAINSRNYRTPAQAYENLGVCSLQIPDSAKAEVYFRKALRINPRLPIPLLKMAAISVEKGNAMSGRAYLQRYQEVSQLGAEGLWVGIQTEKKLGDVVAVRDYENQLRRHFPDSRELQFFLESEKLETNSAKSSVKKTSGADKK